MKADDIRRGGPKPEPPKEPEEEEPLKLEPFELEESVESESVPESESVRGPGVGRVDPDIVIINGKVTRKVPWPGNLALWNWCMYDKGMTTDRSGWDAINMWLVTANPEELADCQSRAEGMGRLIGMGLGWLAAKGILKLLNH